MSAEEKATRDHMAVKLESMLTHEKWGPLLALLKYDMETDGACSASMHTIDGIYFPKETG